jgi:Cdc6-like AAA superfamily ATPase
MAIASQPNPRRIVDDTIIHHTAYRSTMDHLEELWRDAQARIPIVSPLIGETGTGKSTVAKAFVNAHPQVRTADGLQIPVLYIEVAPNPTPRALGEAFLAALGDPRPTAGSAANKLDRIGSNMESSGTVMVFLDDVQHFIDKRQRIALFAATDYLKTLVATQNVVLVCLGLPEARLVIQSNEQLRTRSQAPTELQRFDWMDPRSQDEFVKILSSFQEVLKSYELPALASPDVSIRMFLATGGLIRYVSRILSRAVRTAIDLGTSIIRIEDIGKAWAGEVDGANDEFPDPFKTSFKLNDLPDKIAAAQKIGQRAKRPYAVGCREPNAVLSEISL